MKHRVLYIPNKDDRGDKIDMYKIVRFRVEKQVKKICDTKDYIAASMEKQNHVIQDSGMKAVCFHQVQFLLGPNHTKSMYTRGA